MQLALGTRKCPLCGTPQELTTLKPVHRLADDFPIVDPLLDLFIRDDVVRFCPRCLNEYGGERGRCRPCDVPVTKAPRSRFEEQLKARPITELGTQVAAGPESVPGDLVRVRVAKDLTECALCLRELQFVGIDPWPGSDSLDPFDTPGAIGIYVRRPDLAAAQFMVGGKRPLAPLTKAPRSAKPAERQDLVEAASYLELGKYKEVIRRMGPLRDDAKAAHLVSEALIKSGRLKEAIRHAEETLTVLHEDGGSRGTFHTQMGVGFALGFDGTPFGRGADLKRSIEELERARIHAPRDLRVGQRIIEVLHAMNRTRSLRVEFERLLSLNPNLVAIDGWYRDLYDSIRLLA